MWSPPTVTERSALRAVSVNCSGTWPSSDIKSWRGMWTRSPCTSAPASFHSETASGSRKSMPICSRMVQDASWIISRPSALRTS